MKGQIVLITFFSILLFTSIIESRHEPADYWRDAIKNEQQLPGAIKDLIHSASKPQLLAKEIDCHESKEKRLFVKDDIEPRPNLLFYPGDVKTKESSAYMSKGGPQSEKRFAEDVEPRPNLSVYNN